MDLATWALPRLSKLLPLDEVSLKQIITYTESLPNSEAAHHLQNLLGDTPQALEFISSFNGRRKPVAQPTSRREPNLEDTSAVPKTKPRKKQQPGLRKPPPPRQVSDAGDTSRIYIKRDEEDYMPASSKFKVAKSNKLSLTDHPEAVSSSSSKATSTSRGVSPAPLQPKLPPSAAGQLISESKVRGSSPKPKAKVNVIGGTAMHGASTALNDLESAIRTLEIQTNPSLATKESSKRKCNCMASRHPLLEAAPNCLNCGKIICIKEGIGPCTFCNTPLLSAGEIQSMVRVLRDERGKEKMAVNNASHKRAEVSLVPRPYSTPRSTTPVSNAVSDADSESEKLAKAKEHRDKLLTFQAQNAKRTQVHDEAADFETTTAGLSMWASPQERALQLKKQQKALREQEWNARPEYDKRQVVASIDLSGKKVVRRMAAIERPVTPDEENELLETSPLTDMDNLSGKAGAFRNNPLLGGLIRPTIVMEESRGKNKEGEKKQSWRRVQDDDNDNEQWILDGGVYGRPNDETVERDSFW